MEYLTSLFPASLDLLNDVEDLWPLLLSNQIVCDHELHNLVQFHLALDEVGTEQRHEARQTHQEVVALRLDLRTVRVAHRCYQLAFKFSDGGVEQLKRSEAAAWDKHSVAR